MTYDIGRTMFAFSRLLPIDECDFDFIDAVDNEMARAIERADGMYETDFSSVIAYVRQDWIAMGLIRQPSFWDNGEPDPDDNGQWDTVERFNLFEPGTGTYVDPVYPEQEGPDYD